MVNIKKNILKHEPEILIGIGMAGMIATTILAVRATPKAVELINEEKYRRSKDRLSDDYVNKRDVIKLTWKCYIPSVVLGGLSISCLAGARLISVRRNTALVTAYTLSETALRTYRDKVVETMGEKKEMAVRDAIVKDTLDNNPVESREIIITDKGDTLCYDIFSGRYFESNIETLKKIENELNRRMRDEMYISLNDLYYEIGLDAVGLGDILGWEIDKGYIDLSFSSQLAKDGTPCVVLNYSVEPKYIR